MGAKTSNTLFEPSQNSDGSPRRIHNRLQQQGWSVGRQRVMGWVARPHPRHSHRKTTGEEATVAQNVLQRQFLREHPDQACHVFAHYRRLALPGGVD